MNLRSRGLLRILGVLALGVTLVSAAFVAGRAASDSELAVSGGGAGVPSDAGLVSPTPGVPETMFGEAPADVGVGGAGVDGTDTRVAQETKDASASGDRLVIRTAGITVRVAEVETALPDVRRLAVKYRADVTELFVDTPADDVRPLAEGPKGPTAAQITVRVPEEDLDRFTDEVAELGTVVSQSASASDVTEQHIDLEARLKNLRAEEARLRDFFSRATDVKDLLAVQSELSRVRGEIEAMTAQITYLERQAAKATLTISLTEPGPIVSPGAEDWGFRQALTDGLRGAVALITAAITAVIAISPLLALIAVVWMIVRAVRNRRGSGADEETIAQDNEAENANRDDA